MKRILIIISILLFFLVGCTAHTKNNILSPTTPSQSSATEKSTNQNENNLISAMPSADESTEESTPPEDIIEDNETPDDTPADYCLAPGNYATFSQLHEAMRQSWHLDGSGIDATESAILQQNGIVNIPYYYVPDCTIPGYTLENIAVGPGAIGYFYRPTNIEKGEFYEYLVITIDWKPLPGYEDPLEYIEQRIGKRKNDGYVYQYSSSGCSVWYQEDKHLISVRDENNDFTYEQLKEFCNIRRVTVKADHVTE